MDFQFRLFHIFLLTFLLCHGVISSSNITVIGNPVAGQVYTLLCGNATNATWKYSNGTTVMSNGKIIVSNNRNLTFNPLLTSHGGNYTCLSGNTSNNITVIVQIPQPKTTISSNAINTSMVYSGTSIQIVCTVHIPSVVDTPVVVKTFWIGTQGPITNGNRTNVTTVQAILVHNTTLQISPLNISDSGMYQCVGNISSNSTYIKASNNSSANISLSIQALPPPVVIISSYGSPIAGSVYSLVCTVKVVDGLVAVPNIVLMKDSRLHVNGVNATTSNSTMTGGNSTLTVTFSPLRTSHGGQYTCVATISIPQIFLNVTNSTLVNNISVQITPQISVNHSGGSLVAGTKVAINCFVLFFSYVDTEVMVNITWNKNSTGAFVVDNNITYIENVTYVSEYHNFNYHNSSLVFSPVGSGDSGVYTCVATLKSLAPYAALSAYSSNATSVYLSIKSPPGLNVSINSSPYIYTINRSYLLTCRVMADGGLVVPIDIIWTKINGMDTKILSSVTTNSRISNYTFSSLSQDDSAVYSCTAAISFPPKSINNSVSAFIDVSLKPPDMVQAIQADVISERELSIKWDQPHLTNGAMKNYTVLLSVLEDYGVHYNSTSFVLNANTSICNASGLGAGISYEVCVHANNSAGAGKPSCIVIFTKELTTTAIPNNVTIQRSADGRSMNISWTPVPLAKARGFPLYIVSYGPLIISNQRTAAMLQVFSNGSYAFISGLDPYQPYSVTLSVYTQAGTISSNISVTSVSPIESGPSTITYGIIGGVIAGVVVFTLMTIIIAVYCIVQFRNQRTLIITTGKGYLYDLDDKGLPEQTTKRTDDYDVPTETHSPQYENVTLVSESDHDRMNPISLLSFRDHVMKMHADDNKAFEHEYQLLPVDVGTVGPQSVSILQCNSTKNRFVNILPYDETRVVLQEIPNVEGSDYINANYVDGYHQQRLYIASQGPMECTLNDFWRMIWEQCVQVIVMLTKCTEDRKCKCDQYWADDIGQDFITADFTITITASDTLSDYVVRTLTLKHKFFKSAPHLVVTQYQFVSWPDFGVPKNSYALVSFIQRIQKLRINKCTAPILVHCSAGVGRTGMFILLDILLERMKSEDSVDVYAALCKIRRCRESMVQTQDQYVFVHDALVDYIMCGDTSISASNLRNKTSKMSKVAPGYTVNVFEQQFQLIENMSNTLSVDCSDGAEEFNASKNRYPDKLPYNKERVYLRKSTAEGSDYINASMIPGYKRSKTYIAVQAPLEKTVNDFWRLLVEFKSKTIVMLCPLTEEGAESSYCYWPTTEKATQSYGTMSVTLLSSDVKDGFIIRKFNVQNEKARKQEFIVTQFHFTEWRIHGKPSDSAAMLLLLDLVNKAKIGNGNTPITVTCDDGMGRTGTFICIDSELERLKSEGFIDIFQCVKSSRCCRPHLVENVVQYAYCHEIMACYFESMDTYSNF